MIKILINAGHDPECDSGAVNWDLNLRECDITQQIGKAVIQKLEGCDDVYAEFIQQDNLGGEGWYDYNNSVIGYCNNNEFNYAISIHCNACTTHEAQGAETYVYSYDSKAVRLAQNVQDRFVNDIGMNDRYVRANQSFMILRMTECPTILCECGFIDNRYDAVILRDRTEEFAQAIVDGLLEFLQDEGEIVGGD